MKEKARNPHGDFFHCHIKLNGKNVILRKYEPINNEYYLKIDYLKAKLVKEVCTLKGATNKLSLFFKNKWKRQLLLLADFTLIPILNTVAGLQTRFSSFMPNAQKSVFLAVLSSRKKGLSAKNFPSLTISLFQIKKKMLRFIDFFKYE